MVHFVNSEQSVRVCSSFIYNHHHTMRLQSIPVSYATATVHLHLQQPIQTIPLATIIAPHYATQHVTTLITLHYTLLHNTTRHHTTLHYATLHYLQLQLQSELRYFIYTTHTRLNYNTVQYITLDPLHPQNCNCNYTEPIIFHNNYNSTILYNYSCTTPHYIQQLQLR